MYFKNKKIDIELNHINNKVEINLNRLGVGYLIMKLERLRHEMEGTTSLTKQENELFIDASKEGSVIDNLTINLRKSK